MTNYSCFQLARKLAGRQRKSISKNVSRTASWLLEDGPSRNAFFLVAYFTMAKFKSSGQVRRRSGQGVASGLILIFSCF